MNPFSDEVAGRSLPPSVTSKQESTFCAHFVIADCSFVEDSGVSFARALVRYRQVHACTRQAHLGGM